MDNNEEIQVEIKGANESDPTNPAESSSGSVAALQKKRRRRRWPVRKHKNNAEKTVSSAEEDLQKIEPQTATSLPAQSRSDETLQTQRHEPEQPRSYNSKKKKRRYNKGHQAETEAASKGLETTVKDTTKRILINASYPLQHRVAIVEGSRLMDFYVESSAKQQVKGNIYKGVVSSILPSLQAAFVDFGHKKNGFLQLREIMPELYLDKQEGKRNIQRAVSKGQEILVQVEKDEHDTKGASLTTYISLPGRYIVMMPGQQRIGISRKIESRKDRDHLREIFNSLKLPKNMGFILRTACSDSLEQELNRDLKYLTRLWQSIKTNAEKSKAPALIYKEQDIAMRTVRDYLTTDVSEILIDHKETYNATRSYLKKIIPGRTFNVIHYKEKKSLFSLYNIESQISGLNEPYVHLPSRGYLVFGKTEALTAIDVNSGRGKKEDTIEATVLNTNLEAVDEIARQIRLRDIGGLIVIDFIDMQSGKNRKLIEQRMTDVLASDKANTEIAPLSKFCIMEMTRERIRPSYAETTSIECPLCSGRGIVRSNSTTALAALRELQNLAAEGKTDTLTCRISLEGGNILLNDMRADIAQIEKDCGVRLNIICDPSLPQGQYAIETG